MDGKEPNRRIWAPKVRTGCQTCKAKHVKCDEARPRCKKSPSTPASSHLDKAIPTSYPGKYCERRNLHCQYNPPRANIFEVSASRRAAEARSSRATEMCSTLNIPWGSPEETQALQFYLDKIGPWVCGYGPWEGLALWHDAIPRAASSLPTLKHLLTTVALLEAPIHDATESKIRARYQSVMRHYTKGLHGLRQPSLQRAETALGPVLAFVIEVLKFETATADMHLRAAFLLREEALQNDAARGEGPKDNDDFIYDAKHASILASIHMMNCLRAKVRPHRASLEPYGYEYNNVEDDGTYASLSMLNKVARPTSSASVRAAITHYFTHIHASTMDASTEAHARAYLHHWQGIVLQNKYCSPEGGVVFNALDLLCNLAHILLPVPLVVAQGIPGVDNDQAKHSDDGYSDDRVRLALDFVVQRARWMLGRCLSRRTDLLSMYATLRLILEYTVMYSPYERSRRDAKGALVLLREKELEARRAEEEEVNSGCEKDETLVPRVLRQAGTGSAPSGV